MSKRQIRLSDLAKELGISTATVSRALKNYPDISQETKRRVLELSERWHYRPNSMAAGLRKSETNIIGVILPKIVDHFFSHVIRGITKVAYDAKFKVMLCQSDESFEKEVSNAEALLASRVDGLLISLSNDTAECRHIEDFQESGTPVVFFDKKTDKISGCSYVVVDDYKGAYEAVRHLIEQGCRRIAHIQGPQLASTFRMRYQGYADALRDAGIAQDESYVFLCEDLTHQNGLLIGEKMSKMPQPPDGLFAVTDLAAIGAMVGMKRNGLSIPEDVCVVGFSNWELNEVVDPPLSSVSQPSYEMGMLAAEMLLKEIQAAKSDEAFEPEEIVLETSLVKRTSSRRNPH